MRGAETKFMLAAPVAVGRADEADAAREPEAEAEADREAEATADEALEAAEDAREATDETTPVWAETAATRARVTYVKETILECVGSVV